ncbi:LmbE family protein [Nonlabens spongiae]|uniref:LmbE family protein n=2 Tax=Nonlabens spongiae TaxID=331648 RepID=A0A1W6MII7_9FLAO|nr:LmbE family protein [Nonlabens spongiae]
MRSTTTWGRLASVLVIICSVNIAIAQENRLAPQQPNTSEIYQKIKKLGFLGSALYLAAHPDDENTRLISWLANDKQARTAYLSLTRGDGGQNLIGPELREQLGMIRSQELLEARNLDGGNQFFTRANDFGYSKHPDETLEIWNEEEVLKDVVRIIRKFKPDVIINRFNHRTAGTTHGHHTSSAMLGMEAYDLADDSAFLPEVESYKPERIFFNTSWWFYGSRDAFAKADKTNLLEIEAGSYYLAKGLSNNEIAALSRSQHKSQGFGSSGSRDRQTEYLEYLKGSFPEDKSDIFSGINTTWTRVKGGSPIQTQLNQIIADYDFKKPTKSLNQLAKLHNAISKLDDGHWKDIKIKELEELMLDITGFYAQASVRETYTTGGEHLQVNLETTNRSDEKLQIEITKSDNLQLTTNSFKIPAYQGVNTQATLTIPEDAPYSTPYYLEKEGSMGMYKVDDPELIGLPEDKAAFQVPITVTVAGIEIKKMLPIIHKSTDPVRGEVLEPLHIVPALSVKVEEPVYIFQSGESKKVNLVVKAFADVQNISPSIKLPASWDPGMRTMQVFDMKKGEQRSFTFTVTAPSNQSEGTLEASINANGKTYNKEVIQISYDHIPDQQLVRDATAKIVNPNLTNNATTIAYINGAGDAIPAALEAMGSTVFTYDPANVPADLSKYDVIVTGIRAYNVAEQDMTNLQSRLADFVRNGGTLVQQYNTSRGLNDVAMGPLEISLSRKRTTDENATITFLNPEHPVLNYPNKITQADFEGWVQERGLYFPEAWDEGFTPILGMADAGEEMTRGSLLVAPYGKGHVVYTGLSFFRELPAGVAGAYRLFANIINLDTQKELKTESDARD